MTPTYRPTVEVDGTRATITMRNVNGEAVEVVLDTWTARKLTLALSETLMEAGRTITAASSATDAILEATRRGIKASQLPEIAAILTADDAEVDQ